VGWCWRIDYRAFSIVNGGAGLLGGVGVETFEVAVFEADVLAVAFNEQDAGLKVGFAAGRQP